MSDVIDAEFTMPIEEMSNEDLLADLVRVSVEIINHHIISSKQSLKYLNPSESNFVRNNYEDDQSWQYFTDPIIMKLINIITQMEVNSHD